jgi:methylase of polypeptide subunit release factors
LLQEEEEPYLPTPDLSHLTASDYEHVYEPAEDSFLLLDALAAERRFLIRTVRPALCLEVGSGSGVVSTFLTMMLARVGVSVACLATDLNPRAAKVTRRTAEKNGWGGEEEEKGRDSNGDMSGGGSKGSTIGSGTGDAMSGVTSLCTSDADTNQGPGEEGVSKGDTKQVTSNKNINQGTSTNNATLKTPSKRHHLHVEPVIADLAFALEPRLRGNVDILVFNPPYVVTPPHEVGSTGIEASWAGGDRGREVLDRLLPSVPALLSPRGVFYLVVIKENNPKEIGKILAKSGLKMETVMSRRSGPEFLSILKFVRKI